MALISSIFTQATLYKFRYVLGFGAVITLLLFVVTTDLTGTPNGISQAEMTQAVASTSLHFSLDFSWATNLPYNFIQKVAIEAFGLSRLSLVLPSLVFGIATIIVFSMTMRHWFRDSVAVVATAICVTSVPFVSMLRSGTPTIMLSFWTILLLYGAVRLLVKRDKAFAWKLLIVVSAVGLLYTPFGIYPLLAIFGSSLFHPHVRSRLRHIKRIRLIILGIIGLIGLVPLAVQIIHHPATVTELTGIDTVYSSLSHLRENFIVVYETYINILKNGFAGTEIIPVFNAAAIALMLLGFFQTVKNRYTARAYVLLSWSVVTVLAIIFMPDVRTLVFIPASLLLAVGIDTLVVEWYSLFPRNPYARVAGLIPLTVLFLGIASGDISHYFNNYNHITNTSYSQSLPAIQKALVTEGNHKVILVTTPADVAFYSILQTEHSDLTVTSQPPATTQTPTFVLPDVVTAYTTTPSRILTSSFAENSVVLRIYRPQ